MSVAHMASVARMVHGMANPTSEPRMLQQIPSHWAFWSESGRREQEHAVPEPVELFDICLSKGGALCARCKKQKKGGISVFVVEKCMGDEERWAPQRGQWGKQHAKHS
eukprot:2230573-Rhodomonas_salina.1